MYINKRYHNNFYYALVWSKDLTSEIEVIGEKITRNTVLPKDSRMLYTTNGKDLSKIVKVKTWKEITYDPLTTKQSVKFWDETEEYTLKRDVCILVWEGSEILSLPSKQYKIVSPELFEEIIELKYEELEDKSELETNIEMNMIKKSILNLERKALKIAESINDKEVYFENELSKTFIDKGRICVQILN